MNIAFLLVPKSDLAWVKASATLGQAIERMDNHGCTAVPILGADGSYCGSLTEGDILAFWKQHPEMRFEDAERVPIASLPWRSSARAIDIDGAIEDLPPWALDHDFVPVVDSRSVFIGIVLRRSILDFFQRRMARQPDKAA